MSAVLCPALSHFPTAIHNRLERRYGAVALLWLLLLACGAASAQNTTISGTVYDPRTANALPLPNVLVYASTTPVSPPATGVQCLTFQNQTPTGANVVSYTYSATDGTFTLQNIPENASYTIVIQAGKWWRQYQSQAVGAGPLTGLVLSMPADHTQGNIPLIAIVTGSADGAECVLHDMGIADSEFTDDTQTGNPGRIHLYRGSGNAGAEIGPSTPLETMLTENSTLLNSYDMVMFPCQGGQYAEPSAGLQNLLSYANQGGRLFTTHFSYVYLDPALGAQFPAVADWDPQQSYPTPDPGIATVQTNFSDGAILAQWLQNSGATYQGSATEIQVNTLRHDFNAVIPPTQSWLTLNDAAADNPVMQMTFNTPVGAPLAQQCGRVLYNEYHVITPAGGTIYPGECPTAAPTSSQLAQEEMLEYALFDLSAFVQPVVVPTLNVTFSPSPLLVKSGDTAGQLTVNVINTSMTTETDSSAVLSFTLPSQLTVTAMSDPAGGWTCTVGTLSCLRNTSLPANTTDSVTLTLSVASYTTLASYTGQIVATISSVTFSTNPSFTENVIFQQAPTIAWATPAPIVYGTPLSAVQLDASARVAGAFSYSPAAGTILTVGLQTLNATFTPTDTTDYTTATASVKLNVVPGTPTITLTSSPNPAFLTYPVSFTASLPPYASAETGSMTYYSGTIAIGTASVSGGSATFTTTSLPVGAQSITAAYSGDADYAPAASNAITETVQDFTLTFAEGAASASAQPGGQTAYSLVVTPVNGPTLPAAVTLSASNLPLGMTAAFAPAMVAAGSTSTTVTMTIALPGKSANVQTRSPFGGGALPVALGLILLPVAGRLRKGRAHLFRVVVLFAIGAALAAGFSGCGAKTMPRNFSFSVTAASGSLSHSLTPQLTVE